MSGAAARESSPRRRRSLRGLRMQYSLRNNSVNVANKVDEKMCDHIGDEIAPPNIEDR